jgi:hypothetical protein
MAHEPPEFGAVLRRSRTAAALSQEALVSALAVGSGSTESAARLIGAAEKLYDTSGTRPQPHAQEALDQAAAAAHAELGPEACAAAWEGGHELSPAQAVLEAREVMAETAAPGPAE